MNTKLKYQEGYRYQVYEDVLVQTALRGYTVVHDFFSLSPEGLLIIRRGYAWDGASGRFTLQTKTNRRGSLVHDVLYQAMRLGLLPQECFHAANAELRRICIEDGMWKIRADYYFSAVEKFGDAFAQVQPDVVLIAP